MLNWILNYFPRSFSMRENEFDTAEPGASRSMTGIFHSLPEKQKWKLLSYKGAEYCGGRKKTVS